jgi:hypothetical protein
MVRASEEFLKIVRNSDVKTGSKYPPAEPGALV